MYINAVLSYFGAFGRLKNLHPEILDEIFSVIAEIDSTLCITDKSNLRVQGEQGSKDAIDLEKLRRLISNKFNMLDWIPKVIQLATSNLLIGMEKKKTLRAINLLKKQVGIDIAFGKTQFLESKIYSDLPLFFKTNSINLAVFLVPMRSFAHKSFAVTTNFEVISNRLSLIDSTILRYPFVIIGISDVESELQVIELTTELDQYLIEKIGLSLQEMLLRNEMTQYDFKLMLPPNDRLAKDICAMANNSGGGLLLLGIDKTGKVEGLMKGKDLDDLQLRASNIIHDTVIPRPKFHFIVFDIPGDPSRCILVIQVDELENKPCMTNDRVYIRTGNCAIPAGPEEIRRLIIGFSKCVVLD